MFNLFVRQPFTESSAGEKQLIQSVLDEILSFQQDIPFTLLTDPMAQDGNSFRQRYEELTGSEFDAQEFRQWRLSLLDQADAIIYIRTSLSESSAFEIAYNIFKGKRAPILFCLWIQSPLKTTLLSDLHDLCEVGYAPFSRAADLREPIRQFLSARARDARRQASA